MKKLILIAATASIIGGAPILAQAAPSDDLKALRSFYQKKFPNVKFEDMKDGIYALDADRREAWLEFEDFAPPYEDAVEVGKKEFNKPFKNGKSYASCFDNGGIGIRQNYPYFDRKNGNVVTLEAAINSCRKANGEKPYKWKTGNMAAVSAYMAYTSRGKKINIKISNDPRSLAIYEKGKKFFYAKRGQLNFSCADCHVGNAGGMVRGNLMGTAIGQVTHWPAWRKKWQKKSAAKGKTGPLAGLGTLQRRYGGCNKQVRAKPFKAQSPEYTALEYFHQYISNGQEVNAPGLRQ